ncbi:DUF3168 domain-containing protein [Jiella marina]|uniref:DUF3168 domain-containing protein n=1 Tax=Jiella sp. LLJ827 TaxID=2917712 RepID=UPI002100E4CF|nr:DUF3168 domain-containing protein [Jiella sp. LLJ827]MCQ0987545.1 DUF3168 domain-containing protein [Jiella sp. LLJ827]
MTAFAWELQKALYAAITAAEIGAPLFDEPRPTAAKPYLSFGPYDGQSDDADCVDGIDATQQIDIWSSAEDGFREAKVLAGKLRSAVHGQEFALSGARVVDLTIESERFIMDADGKTKHGVLFVRALMDQA